MVRSPVFTVRRKLYFWVSIDIYATEGYDIVEAGVASCALRQIVVGRDPAVGIGVGLIHKMPHTDELGSMFSRPQTIYLADMFTEQMQQERAVTDLTLTDPLEIGFDAHLKLYR